MTEDYAQFKIRVHKNDTETIAQMRQLVDHKILSKTVVKLLKGERSKEKSAK